jgi:hypothetical protein
MQEEDFFLMNKRLVVPERKKERIAAMSIQKIRKRYTYTYKPNHIVGFKFLLTIFNDIYILWLVFSFK